MRLPDPPTSLLDKASLFLDFDGTLVDLAPRPDDIEVGAELLDLLVMLREKLGGRVALLSGRSAEDIGCLLEPMELPVGGSHGLERVLPGREADRPRRPIGLEQMVATLGQLEADYPGVHIEEKPAGIAIHYRLAPHAASVCLAEAERAAATIGLALQHGKMVVELKPAGTDKGTAIRAFMAEPPFAGTRPVFIGDDLTDEHGFVAVRKFDGAGVLVGAERETAAIYRLENVAAVRSWLRTASEALT